MCARLGPALASSPVGSAAAAGNACSAAFLRHMHRTQLYPASRVRVNTEDIVLTDHYVFLCSFCIILNPSLRSSVLHWDFTGTGAHWVFGLHSRLGLH